MTTPKAAREPVKCDRPGCPNMFVPRTKVNKYCCKLCQRRVQEYRFVLGVRR